MKENSTIQLKHRLSTLPGNSIFAQAIRNGVETDLNGTVDMILSQLQDNRVLVIDIVGEDLVLLIDNLKH
jgi:hypothetical protein